MKKLLSICMIISILFSSSLITHAASTETSLDQVIASTNDNFKNLTIKKADSSTTNLSNVRIINTRTELNAFLTEFNNLGTSTNSVGTNSADTSSSNQNTSWQTGKTYTSSTKNQWIGAAPYAPPVKINMFFKYTTKKRNGNWIYNAIYYRDSWLTGVQFPVGYSWSKKDVSISKYSNYQKVKFTLVGTMTTHAIYNGSPITIMNTNVRYVFRYSL